MATREPFSVGAVLSRSFSSWFANFFPFSVLGALLYLPLGIYTWLIFRDLDGVVVEDLRQWQMLVTFGGLLLKIVLTGALVYGVFRQLRGKRATMASCIVVGISRLIPVIFVGLAMGILIFLCAIPIGIAGVVYPTSHLLGILIGIAAFILLFSVVCRYWVAIPVAVVEKPGISASLQRSAELTKGKRVQIFGILFLLFIFEFVLGKIVQNVWSVDVGSTMADIRDLAWAMLVLSLEMAILQAITATVIYHDLRLAKEGVGIEELAAVFD